MLRNFMHPPDVRALRIAAVCLSVRSNCVSYRGGHRPMGPVRAAEDVPCGYTVTNRIYY